jgi:hypothetical protein
MPSREDEFYSGRQGQKGEPLCPFCGSKQVYPIKTKFLLVFTRNKGWSCANENCRMYRKIFPNPSWGTGGWHR